MMNKNESAIKQAKKLLLKNNINTKQQDLKKLRKYFPIVIESITDSINVKVIKYPFSNEISGTFIRKGNQLLIGVNKGHHEHRRRFTIAHEIGHCILHSIDMLHSDCEDLETVFYRADKVSNIKEIEANLFAAELLMPEDAIHTCIKNDIDTILNLAEFFNVSEYAMRYRLTNLGYL